AQVRFCPRRDAGPWCFEIAQGTTGFVLTTVAPAAKIGVELSSPSRSSVLLAPNPARSGDVGGAVLRDKWFSERSAEMVASVTAATGGRFRAAYDVPAALKAGELDLVLRAAVEVGPDVSATARQTIEKLQVLLPPEFPTITPSQHTLATVTGRKRATGVVSVR